MWYIEIKYLDSKGWHTINIDQSEEADNRAYFSEGKQAGWIYEYSFNYVEEVW